MRNSMQELGNILKDMTPEEREHFTKQSAEYIIKEVKAGNIEAKRIEK